ncbi:hypothetical protein [Streptomyces collinus]|uniref:hypothetical protein n=1 Tax=Streptomyces collinus TaxID=42684 RepID=UPI0036B2B664
MYTLLRPTTADSGNVGWAQLSNGSYLMMVGGFDSQPLDFYTSSSATGPYSFLSRWQGSFKAFQNTNLVTECGTGNLYLIGSYENGASEDWLETYALNVPANGATPTVTPAGRRHMVCTLMTRRQCDFDAAGGSYVSPAHEIFFYSTEHAHNGPDGTVKLTEFRTINPNPQSCNSALGSAWVELFEDSNFEGDSLMIDYSDQFREDYSDYTKVERFGDRVSSARWCLPEKLSYKLYQDDNFRGTTKTLTGVGEDADFDRSPGITAWTDKVSSSQYVRER